MSNMTNLFKTSLFAMALGFATQAHSDVSMPLPSGSSSEAAAAYAMLDKHCARCHQDGALKDGLTASKSGFGHVLDLKRLAQDPKYVIQGDANASKLYNVIGQYSFPAMPDDCAEESCFPTSAELAALESWIINLANQAPPARPIVTLSEAYAAAHADLLAQPTNRRDRIRYISLRVVHNDADVSEENWLGYQAATVKMLNALSWNPMPYKAEPVGPGGVLLRVYLPDLQWSHETWSYLEEVYPYGMTSATDPNLQSLQHAAGTQIPVIRADWMASRATVSPLYYDMLGLPDTVQGLEQMLGFSMVRNMLDEQVVRAGFQDSGVSSHNRLIERHAIGTGFFWTSYDFAGSQGRQSFFEYPLGPKEAYGETHAFLHDGGESIFTLPNGFHAYYLNTADGARLDVGPTEIVRDDDYTDGTGEVVNGISCISCHSKGMRLNEDKVRDVALGDLSLPPEVRQTIDAIYPGQDEVAMWLQRDTDQFRGALERAGIDPAIQAGGLEPVRGLFVYHVDLYVDFAQAANELGMTEDELRARAGFVGQDLASLILRLDQSPIARDEWTAVYPTMLERVTDYKPLIYQADHAPAHVSYSVQQARGADYKPPVDTTYKPPADYTYTQQPDYKPADHSAPARGHLTVYTDKPEYKVGEGLKIIVEPRYDCRLTLINIDDHKRSCVLYPHPQLPDETIKGGSRFVFPPRGSLKTQTPGVETILAICNGSKEAVEHEYRDTSHVSCDATHRTVDYNDITYKNVVTEVLTLDLNDDTKPTGSGSEYRAISNHNPYVAKAHVKAKVTEY